MMNVLGTKELYEAWENMYHDYIEDYRTSEVRIYNCFKYLQGEVAPAEKVDWIVKLPKIFCM